MSCQRLIPPHEELTVIVTATQGFLSYLRDAALIEGAKAPLIPQATVAYRKGQIIYKWAEWERAMNPSRSPFGGTPPRTAAAGWIDWEALHLALVDLQALHYQLMNHWGVTAIVGADSVRPSYEGIGAIGGGAKALFLEADTSHSSLGRVRIQKPFEWPPPVTQDWSRQCRYALKRIKKVMSAEGTKIAEGVARPVLGPEINGELIATSTQSDLAQTEAKSEPFLTQWTSGTLLAKVNELTRRLRSWHVEDFRSLVQFASERESRGFVRTTFRDLTAGFDVDMSARPAKSFQLYMNESGEIDENGYMGEVHENPDRDTDRQLTLWLLRDFRRHLELFTSRPAVDYLREIFDHFLDLPAWRVRGPNPGESFPETRNRDEKGEPRSYMVIGASIPIDFLSNLINAAEKILTLTNGDINSRNPGDIG